MNSTTLFSLDYTKLFDSIKEKVKSLPPSSDPTVTASINAIKELATEKYFDQTYLGAAALNRMILQDREILRLLTKDTLKEMIRQQALLDEKPDALTPAHPLYLYRNVRSTTLISVLTYSFGEGIEAMKYMPSNDLGATFEDYSAKIAHFESNFLPLTQCIVELGGELGVNMESQMKQEEKMTLSEKYDRLLKVVDKIKENKLSESLLRVNGYSATAIRGQSKFGFAKVLSHLVEIEGDTREEVLKSFANNCLKEQKIMVTGSISHLFYDRVHFEACMESDEPVEINGHTYLLREILYALIYSCEQANSQGILYTQMRVRLNLVEQDLMTRKDSDGQEKLFAHLYEQVVRDEPSYVPLSSGPSHVITPLIPAMLEVKKPEARDELKNLKERVTSLINNYHYELGCFGGTYEKSAGKKISAGAQSVLNILKKEQTQQALTDNIHQLLGSKLTVTCGFFGIGARRQSTVSLYQTILAQFPKS